MFPRFLSAATQDTVCCVDELQYPAASMVGPVCGSTEPTCDTGHNLGPIVFTLN